MDRDKAIELLNYCVSRLKDHDAIEGMKWTRVLPEIPLPEHMGFTLLALLFLAVADAVLNFRARFTIP